MINIFHKTKPVPGIQVSLTLIDGVILKINDNDNENVIEKVYDLRDNMLYMLSFEKLIRD